MAENVGFIQEAWSAQADALLVGATGSNPSYTVNELRREVEAGQARLFRVVDRQAAGDRLLGYVVLWVEEFGGGRELVIQAGAKLTNLRWDVLRYVQPGFERLTLENDCSSMRVHLSDPALEAKFKRLGWRREEVVLRRPVS